MNDKQESQITQNGLRYKVKGTGSPFMDSSNGMTISCYKCGLHKSRALGVFKMMINQRMFMCLECNQPKTV